MMATEMTDPLLAEVQEMFGDWIIGAMESGGYIAVHRTEGLDREDDHRKVTVTADFLELLAARLHVQQGLRRGEQELSR
ncbi:hypothetical protein [Streptomonospora litoralis]|uniref:Uncharacterized protein n=1 Tax=Streptomonospora litoralis TaxID=2498135 RepID=A0A4P6PZ43_9ACTN|nr:hypothetical protein [Streptomonospora litoralis]QBI53403.1 hypothetical protein EKD16_08045 [Streptomonospora litoralis]